MQLSKSSQTVTQRTLLNSGLLHGGKNVQNADKFEKFELLKERFKTYRENVLKAGFDNLLRTHPSVTGSCTNVHLSNFNLFSSTSSSPSSSSNLHKQNCCCSFCAYCSQQQTILAEIAYLNNLEHDIKEIRDYLRDTRKKLESKELKAKLASDWKRIALVLDRTFFYIYLIITIVTIIILFPNDAINKTSSVIKSAETPTTTKSSVLTTLSDTFNSVAASSLFNRNNEQNS